ncbi:hypothetical protein A0H81_05055 [Grifola frondosa]|uniref:Methyltransferase FkbM domain-containing protein n=1 Tax=Grifola frondosa TaxID=5627 RepID=A0A1C7MCL2_GRIFR|nr:hypothetical protein A0H81_05055 [Grifola frondosa]
MLTFSQAWTLPPSSRRRSLHQRATAEVWAYDYTHNPDSPRRGRPPRLERRAKDVDAQELDEHNGHTHIDFLRVDIEGWEWEVFRNIVRDFTEGGGMGQEEGKSEGARAGVLPFAQLQIELHVWHQRFPDFLAWWEMLEAAGLRPFMNEINLVYANYNRQSGVELAEYSFLNSRAKMRLPPTHLCRPRLHHQELQKKVRRMVSRLEANPPWAGPGARISGLVRHMIIVIAYFLILLRTRRWMKTFIT